MKRIIFFTYLIIALTLTTCEVVNNKPEAVFKVKINDINYSTTNVSIINNKSENKITLSAREGISEYNASFLIVLHTDEIIEGEIDINFAYYEDDYNDGWMATTDNHQAKLKITKIKDNYVYGNFSLTAYRTPYPDKVFTNGEFIAPIKYINE